MVYVPLLCLTMVWDATFDVHRDLQSKASVWIKFPYRALILEHNKKSIVAMMGPILHFAQREDGNLYPHHRGAFFGT